MMAWLLGLIVAVLIGALFLVRYYSRTNRLARALRGSTTLPIDRLERNRVAKVSGRVRELHGLLEGPLTGRRCVFYWVLVEEHQSDGQLGTWARLINEYRSVDFLIEDDTGSARVALDGAQPLIVLDAHYSSGVGHDASPRLEAYLKRFGRKSTGLFGFNKALRYREGVLEPGEVVAVLGNTGMEPDPNASHSRGSYRSRLLRPVLCSPENGALLVSDDPSVVGAENSAGARATAPLRCPACNSQSGFRSTEHHHECLACGKLFEA